MNSPSVETTFGLQYMIVYISSVVVFILKTDFTQLKIVIKLDESDTT